MNTNENTIHLDSEAVRAALALARGCYQRAIVQGDACLSGADLRGNAAKYSGRYARSRAALLGRMTRAGVPWHERRAAHGRRVLVIGAPA